MSTKNDSHPNTSTVGTNLKYIVLWDVPKKDPQRPVQSDSTNLSKIGQRNCVKICPHSKQVLWINNMSRQIILQSSEIVPLYSLVIVPITFREAGNLTSGCLHDMMGMGILVMMWKRKQPSVQKKSAEWEAAKKQGAYMFWAKYCFLI